MRAMKMVVLNVEEIRFKCLGFLRLCAFKIAKPGGY
jgi:hypothetical protein